MGLVLAALRLSPVSDVSPVRELSVVIGAWIGVRFMGEQGGRLRVVAAALVATGIIVTRAGWLTSEKVVVIYKQFVYMF